MTDIKFFEGIFSGSPAGAVQLHVITDTTIASYTLINLGKLILLLWRHTSLKLLKARLKELPLCCLYQVLYSRSG